MKTKTIAREIEPSEAEIRHAAYLLWNENGRPEGHDFEHWLAAKELLRHRHGRDGGRARRSEAVPASSTRRTALVTGRN